MEVSLTFKDNKFNDFLIIDYSDRISSNRVPVLPDNLSAQSSPKAFYIYPFLQSCIYADNFQDAKPGILRRKQKYKDIERKEEGSNWH